MAVERYPRVEIDLKKLKSNVKNIVDRCGAVGIDVAGVIKGCNGIPEAAVQFAAGGCKYIASSRLEQIEAARKAGIDKEFMLIRVPMLSEIVDAIKLTDISLNSEREVLEALNKEAGVQGKIHQVILMSDLGDLREGFWDKDELVACAKWVETDLKNLKLMGVATNLGCYGSIAATVDKMEELIALAERVEAAIGRKLAYIGGGATTSLPRVMEGVMPARINLLRIGEGILLSRDLPLFYNCPMDFMYQDAFTLKAEIIEIKDKPSHPVGTIAVDAFGRKQVYQDRGIRKRALLGIGKVDYGDPGDIFPRAKGIEVLGASSDHTIVDVENADREYKLGDVLEFDFNYASIVYATNCPNVRIVTI